MKQVKLKYLLSYTLRGIIIRHEHTKDLLSNLTADVQIARQNHVTRNWTKPGTGTYAVATSHTVKTKYLKTSYTVGLNMKHTIQSENFGDGQSPSSCNIVRNLKTFILCRTH